MTDSSYIHLAQSLETLKINLLIEEFAAFAMESGFTESVYQPHHPPWILNYEI